MLTLASGTQTREERIAVSEFQNQTRQVVMNMLPSHVALNFVDFTGFKPSLVRHVKYSSACQPILYAHQCFELKKNVFLS